MAWARLALVAATTAASSSLKPGLSPERSCSALSACAYSDKWVLPEHVLAPLALPCSVAVFSHLPSLCLGSRGRARRLWAAAMHLSALCAALCLAAAAFGAGYPAAAYALSLHLAALFLADSGPAVLLSPSAHSAARHAALAALIAGAWHAGPPLPVVDSPGGQGCCGALVHLGAWAASETLGATALGVVALIGSQ